MITRRKFVSLGAIATLGAQLLSPGRLFAFASKADDLEFLSAEHFQQFVGTTFRVRANGSKKLSGLRLIDVQVKRYKADSENGVHGEAFSLLFRAQQETDIKGDICEVSHAGLGKFALFVSPVTDDPNVFEAIIDRRRES